MTPQETTLYDYRIACQLRNLDLPITALLMAAMMKADSRNGARIQRDWPELVAELLKRHISPGGALDGESPDAFLRMRITRELVGS